MFSHQSEKTPLSSLGKREPLYLDESDIISSESDSKECIALKRVKINSAQSAGQDSEHPIGGSGSLPASKRWNLTADHS